MIETLLSFLQLSLLEIIISITVIFIAYTIKGLSGFGSGLIAIPLLALFLPLVFIVPVLGLISYNGTIVQSYTLRKDVAWSSLLPLIPFSIIGISTAIWLLFNLNENTLIFSLGLFVISYALYSLLSPTVIKGGKLWAIPAGTLGGLVGALFSTGGPFYIIYLKLQQLDKKQMRATIAMIFLIDGGFRIFNYASIGLYTEQVLLLVLILLPVLFCGMYVGNKLHMKMSQKQFNKGISFLLLLSGVMLIYKSTF